MEEELTVKITVDDFRYLVQKENEFDILISCLLSNAKLNYSEDGLSIDSSTASAVIQAISPHDFKIMLEKLKKEKRQSNE